MNNLNPAVGQWTFRLFSTLAPVVVALLLEAQRQIDSGGTFEWRPLASACIGAALVAYAHFARAGTEVAERTAEVATGTNQDADPEVEVTP